MIEKWKSIRSVLKDVSDAIPARFWQDESTVMDWLEKAAEKIGVEPQYENSLAFMKVEDHTVDLPKGLVALKQMAYKLDEELTEADLDQLQAIIGHDNDYFYNGFFGSSYFKNAYQPLRISNNSFGGGIYDSDDVHNLYTNAEHEAQIMPQGFARVSFREGVVVIGYLSYPLDECGDVMIPDDPDYEEALKDYALMRMWERRMNLMEQGAENMYNKYLAQWARRRARVHGNLLLPDTVDESEDIRQMNNRFMPDNRKYYSFFGNLATEEIQNSNGRLPNSIYTNLS